MSWSRSRWQQKANVSGACNLKRGRCACPLHIIVAAKVPISRRHIGAFALLREWNVGRHPPLVFFESLPKMGGEQLIFDPHTNLGAYHEDQE